MGPLNITSLIIKILLQPYQITMIFPVHLEPIESMAPGISDQLSDNYVLNPLQEILQTRRLWLVLILLEELLCRLVLWLCLGTADGDQSCLDLCLSTVHHASLTSSLKQQQIEAAIRSDCSHNDQTLSSVVYAVSSYLVSLLNLWLLHF